jgi:RHH-type proline utilization regulon transcriptional repressor/proline dehydrogenase/delta 1-pyrroline-5-carboxylate dehydrogenase
VRIQTVRSFAATMAQALQRLDPTAWAARPDRLGLLRQLLTGPLGPYAPVVFAAVQACASGPVSMPGPTGESNQWRLVPREPALCLGPGWQQALAQAVQALALGGAAVAVAQEPAQPLAAGQLAAWQAAGLPLEIVDAALMPGDPSWLTGLGGFGLVAYAGPAAPASAMRRALAQREGDIRTLVTEPVDPARYALERVLCIDTTAAGGNATLLAASEAGPVDLPSLINPA